MTGERRLPAAQNLARRAGGFALDVLFPRRCPFCNEVIGFGACTEACAAAAHRVERASGAPVLRPDGLFDGVSAYAPFRYESPVQDAILRMKFGTVPQHVGFYADCMARQLEAALPAESRPDGVVFVPAFRKERRGREDLPAVLARELGRHLRAPVLRGALCKTRSTERQMTLDGEERRQNVHGAYAVKDAAAVAGKHLLVVDDVLTTGATMAECAHALLAAGAARCTCVAIAAVDDPTLVNTET